MIATFLIYLGLAASIVALAQGHFGYSKAAANWSNAALVVLWLYFIVKGVS